ncbi:MAG: serine/threonine-protein kinase, partial [Planctomycetota bacterium]
MSDPDPSPSALESLVEECLARMEVEGGRALDRLCAMHPELAEGLRRRVELLASLDLLELDGERERLPTRMGEFELGAELGAGAMGVVHRAIQAGTGREVAIKVVRPELVLFAGTRERFQREARIAARLEHSNLLSILAVGETQGLPWFAVELVRGGSLHELIGLARARFGTPSAIGPEALAGLFADLPLAPADLASRRLPQGPWQRFALTLGVGLGRALEHAHAHGILHRDIKSSNVLLDVEGRAVLADLGLAVDTEESARTRTTSLVGSLPYVAPEVLDGARGDVRSDIYSLGVTLFEALTFERPFTGSQASELVAAITRAEPTRPTRLVPSLPTDLEAVLLKAIARDPSLRYQTAAALVEDLAAVADGRPTRARPLGSAGRVWHAVRRRPAVSAAIALGVALLALGPLALAWVQASQRQIVQRTNRDLAQVNQRLEAALDAERVERARADANLERAGRAVEVLLAETAGRFVDGVPLMEQVEAELYGRALDLIGELRPQSPDDPAARMRAAELESSAALVLLELGRFDEALARARSGRALLEGLPPTDDLARLRFQLGTRELSVLDRNDSEASLALAQELLASSDASHAPLDRLLWTTLVHGSTLCSRGQTEAGIDVLREGIELAEARLADPAAPSDPPVGRMGPLGRPGVP